MEASGKKKFKHEKEKDISVQKRLAFVSDFYRE